MSERRGEPPARTVLELKIRERRQTLGEFIEYVECFGRDHSEIGTLSLRHLERLVSGHRGDGRPLGPVRPATARLLERVFGLSINALLAPPAIAADPDSANELRERLSASRQVDGAIVGLLREQLNSLRRLDRQMGAVVVYDEVRTKTAQVAALRAHSLSPGTRTALAALLAELSALAGWEALDRHEVGQAWNHHERAKLAAQEASSPVLFAHTLAQQAVILIDIGETRAAVEQLAEARGIAQRSASNLLQSWLAAAHGEGLAAVGRRDDALRAFDTANSLLPTDPVDPELPYLFLGGAHLDRWRGHALAVLKDREAISVLSDALRRLDPSFTRAHTALRIDLASALISIGEEAEARTHATAAREVAFEIGSVRQQRRLAAL